MMQRAQAGTWMAAAVLLLATGLWSAAWGAAPAGMIASDPGETAGAASAESPGSMPTTDCQRCHTCAHPTPELRCLPLCTRTVPQTDPADGPAVVILGALVDRYLPVPFDHEGHARMAEMAGGCSTCHHRTPRGERPPACGSCHDAQTVGTDLRKPGLRGAYHQQCLNCHRQWMDARDCAACHVEKQSSEARASAGKAASRAADSPLSRHPAIPQPTSDFFEGPSAGETTDTRVVFRHQGHVERFGIACVECHHERGCARCHTENGRSAPRSKSVEEHHRPCVKCHKGDMNLSAREQGRCARCHWRSGEPQPAAFDHAETGWPLARYHQPVSCRQCHAKVPFMRPDRECNACHTPWPPESFDHGVTGQLLDEVHAEAACDDCHPAGRFDTAPSCTECHDVEDDGIAFPARRPGEVVEAAAPQPAGEGR